MQPAYHYNSDDPYPESDGKPMAENTEQYEWLVKIKENLEILFANRSDVFIAGDLFWYPIPDRGVTRPMAPDVLVVFGRPKGRRGFYKQWEEENIAPQVVFEILSPSNTHQEMRIKWLFYDRHGVQEYYVYDPTYNNLEIWIRQDKHLKKAIHLKGWISPLLGIRLALDHGTMHIFDPYGQPFLSSVELKQQLEQVAMQAEQEHQRAEQESRMAKQERQRADQENRMAKQERQRAEQERQRADQERYLAKQERQRAERERQRADQESRMAKQEHQCAEQARQRAERLAAQLRVLGVEPDATI